MPLFFWSSAQPKKKREKENREVEGWSNQPQQNSYRIRGQKRWFLKCRVKSHSLSPNSSVLIYEIYEIYGLWGGITKMFPGVPNLQWEHSLESHPKTISVRNSHPRLFPFFWNFATFHRHWYDSLNAIAAYASFDDKSWIFAPGFALLPNLLG